MNLHKISAYLSQMSVDLIDYLLKWLSPGLKQLSGFVGIFVGAIVTVASIIGVYTALIAFATQ